MGSKTLNRYFSLACSIGSISLACGSLLQIPNTTDRISLQRGAILTSLGFIYFVSLTDFCNKYLLETRQGRQFRKKYRLMMSDVMEITNRTSTAFAGGARRTLRISLPVMNLKRDNSLGISLKQPISVISMY